MISVVCRPLNLLLEMVLAQTPALRSDSTEARDYLTEIVETNGFMIGWQYESGWRNAVKKK